MDPLAIIKVTVSAIRKRAAKVLLTSIYNTPKTVGSLKVAALKAITGNNTSLDFSGDALACHVSDGSTTHFLCNRHSHIERSIILSQTFDQYLLKHLLSFVERNSFFIDVGANIGAMSIPIAKRLQNQGVEVIACEANDNIFSRLKDNIALNRLDNVTAINQAISSKDGTIKFFAQSGNDGNMGLSSTQKNHDLEDAQIDEKEVKCSKLDTLSRALQLEKKVSVIKIDVQGGELEVLNGARELIATDRPVLIFEHEDDYHEDPAYIKSKIQEVLDELDYRLFAITRTGLELAPSLDMKAYVNIDLLGVPCGMVI